MKHARLVWFGLALVVVAGTAAFALAGGKASKRAAAAVASSSTACSAEMAAQCTPEMAASCGTSGAAMAANGAECCMTGASATTADAKGAACPYQKSGAKGVHAADAACDPANCPQGACDPANCPPGMCEGMSKGVNAAAVSAGGSCSAHGTKGTAATTASVDGASAPRDARATMVNAGADCCAKGAKGATAAAPAGGAACGTHGSATTAAMPCDACSDMASCQSDIAEAGGKVQIVPLKNGLMYVYSAETSARVRAVQAAVRRQADRVTAARASAEKAHLCPDCREMRGAMASGKLTREVVDIETGCLTLVTSNDPRVVTRLYAMAGVTGGASRATAKS